MAAKKGKSKKSVKTKAVKKVKEIAEDITQNNPEASVIVSNGSETESNTSSQESNQTTTLDNPTALEGQDLKDFETPVLEKDAEEHTTQFNQAHPRPVSQVWLTLQTDKEAYRNAISLTDLFNNPSLPATRQAQAQGIWGVLARSGFFLHPKIEEQYRNQQTCVFCGGQIIIRKTEIGSDAYCTGCNYLYSEE